MKFYIKLLEHWNKMQKYKLLLVYVMVILEMTKEG